jgi:hypothetical protein
MPCSSSSSSDSPDSRSPGGGDGSPTDGSSPDGSDGSPPGDGSSEGSSSDDGSSSSSSDETRALLGRINGLGADAFNYSSIVQNNPATRAILAGLHNMTETIKDPAFWKAVYHGLTNYVKEHPWQCAFLIIAIVLMCNPVALAGFGVLGPVAGGWWGPA